MWAWTAARVVNLAAPGGGRVVAAGESAAADVGADGVGFDVEGLGCLAGADLLVWRGMARGPYLRTT